MPEPLIAQDIRDGRTAVLPVERWDGSDQMPDFDAAAARCRQRLRPNCRVFLHLTALDFAVDAATGASRAHARTPGGGPLAAY